MFAARNYSSSTRLLDWRLTGPAYWDLYESSMNSTIASTTVSDTLTTPTWSGSTASLTGFLKALLVENTSSGLSVILFPSSPGGTIPYYQYNINTNTFSAGVNAESFTREYNDATLLNNNRILLFPFSGTSSQIIDLNGFIASLITFPREVERGVKMDDGNVFIFPSFFPETINAIIYNVYTNSFSDAPIIGIRSVRGLLMKDGRVFCIPGSSATSARIYNRITNTFSTPNATFPSVPIDGYKAILLPDGRILLIGGSNIRIYYPDLDVLVTPTSTLTVGSGEVFCNLLPNGNVSIFYSSGTTLQIFNPSLDTMTTSSVSFPSGSNKYSDAVSLPNGRILFIPFSSTVTNSRAYGGTSGFNKNILLSEYYNN